MLFLLAQVDLSNPDPPWHPEVPLCEGHTDQTQTIVAPALRKVESDESGPSLCYPMVYHVMAYPLAHYIYGPFLATYNFIISSKPLWK